ncbi:uncharacterized protein PHALS_04725 [Plasmopara halstedii]|uniref:Uncharacterized protein n=1 Tax=Plasmopara halstedii TaxID=4781 RepID=A0A0P1AA45_PLAHL|nr:uncharacterized protein PHALS_04725 [Plasmopara halstedii]CEG37286.1 hypothetical protein PHALS_04725 [Plasmopara halstedii]|eukprot:XP_024573655.1 hypothetical protein PHALS_04725 [Plasmopara halstedii]
MNAVVHRHDTTFRQSFSQDFITALHFWHSMPLQIQVKLLGTMQNTRSCASECRVRIVIARTDKCPTVLESDPFNSQDVTMRKRVISTRDYYQR